jgi:catechol 2,3-dioxygenase-like lactoylglutathione lyase family enzyme
MIARLQCVVLDCPDPIQLAKFYQSLLGGAVNQRDRRWALGDDWATLHGPSGFVLCFQRIADYRRPQWPDPAHPQQLHLDFDVADLDQAQDHVLAQGGTLIDGSRGWRVYADPAGHPFCLIPSGNPGMRSGPVSLTEDRP